MKAIEWLKLIKDPELRERALKLAESDPLSNDIECNSIKEAILYGFAWKHDPLLLNFSWESVYSNPPELISQESENPISETPITLLGETPEINPVDVYYKKILILVEDAEKNLSSDDYQFLLNDVHNIYMQNFSRNPSNPVFAAYDVRIKEYFKIHQNQSKAIEGLKKFSVKMKNLCLELAYNQISENIRKQKLIDPDSCSIDEAIEIAQLTQEELRIFKKENI